MVVKNESPVPLIRLDPQLSDRVRDKARRERLGDGYRNTVEAAMRSFLPRKMPPKRQAS